MIHVLVEVVRNINIEMCIRDRARTVISAFVARLDPTLEELADIKTAVSEAVTNAIIHGYEKNPGMVRMAAKIEDLSLIHIY